MSLFKEQAVILLAAEWFLALNDFEFGEGLELHIFYSLDYVVILVF